MADPTQFSGRAAPGGGLGSALVVGALLVAFLVLAVAKPWEQPTPTPSPFPAANASVTPSADASLPIEPSATPIVAPQPALVPFVLARPPAPGAAWTVIRWQRLDPANPLAHLGTALHWAGGYASVGDDGMGGTVLWTSPDGTAWNPIGSGTATTFWPGMHVEGVAPFGHQLLAVTSLPDESAPADQSTPGPSVLTTWLSDNGVAWQLHGGPIFPSPTRLEGPVLVAGSGEHAVIAWNEAPGTAGQGTGHLAVTDDGAAWRPVPASALPSGFEVTDLAAAPGSGFLVSGRTSANGATSASIVRSDATARAWTPVALPSAPELAIGEAGATVVWQLVAGATGVLAGGDSPSRALWWRSADGRRWTRLPDFAPVGSIPCSGVAQDCGLYPDGFVVGNGDQIVAIGAPGPTSILRTLTSPDGSRWHAVRSAGAIPTGRPYTARLLPGGLVLVESEGAWYGEASAGP